MTSPTKAPIEAAQPVAMPEPQPVHPVQLPVYGSSMPNIIVPPGGFAGFAQQTPATQQLFARAGRVGGKRSAAKRRRKSAAKKKAARVGARRKRRSSARKLVKGSAAAKRRMAALRRMRKRR